MIQRSDKRQTYSAPHQRNTPQAPSKNQSSSPSSPMHLSVEPSSQSRFCPSAQVGGVGNHSPNPLSSSSRERVEYLSPDEQTTLINRVRREIRVRHYSIRTEHSYTDWVERFVLFHEGRNPRYLEALAVNEFLSFLATDLDVAASTQNQALCALLFMYRSVFDTELGDLGIVHRAGKRKRLPVVLSMEETAAVLSHITGTRRLMTELLYGTGMRILEVIRLRVKDLDFQSRIITIREAKGDKDRTVGLPPELIPDLQTHLERVRERHQKDLEEGYGTVHLPHAWPASTPPPPKSGGGNMYFRHDSCQSIRDQE